MSGEIDCGPMHWMCVLVEPVNAGGVDSTHSGTSSFKFFFCGRSRRFPKEFCKIFVFVFLREVVDKVPETIAMSRAREPGPNALQKTLLMIRKEGNILNLGDGDRKVLVHNQMEALQKPVPIFVVFSTDNGKGKQKELASCIRTSRSKEDTTVFRGEMSSIEAEEGSTMDESVDGCLVRNENSSKFGTIVRGASFEDNRASCCVD